MPIDALRGFIMVVMALDHANNFVARQHTRGEFWFLPLPRYDSDLAFLTRFVTHLAAPGFFFLMGVGMMLFRHTRRREGWTEGAITRHFLLRGALLILLQLLIENRAWPIGMDPELADYFRLYMGVLYGLGGAMIVASLITRLPSWALVATGLLAVIITEAVLPPSRLDIVPYSAVMRLLFVPGDAGDLHVYYPVVPWLGVVALGLAFGRWVSRDREGAYKGAVILGWASLFLFVVVRVAGSIGNIRPAEGLAWTDFLNLVKYPPSAVFLLLTLGADLILLWALSRWGDGLRRWGRPLVVFGQSALFFYLLHLFLYALLGLPFAPEGISLVLMYPIWLLGLLILYPLCLWYGRFKQRQKPGSFWRLL